MTMSRGGRERSTLKEVSNEKENHVRSREEIEKDATASSQHPDEYNPDGEWQYRSCDVIPGCDGPRGKGRGGCTANPLVNMVDSLAANCSHDEDREDLEQVALPVQEFTKAVSR